jgi:RHS repeat-associated protein
MTEMTMNGSGSALVWDHTNVWATGKIIATYSQDNTGSQTEASLLHFYLDDPLGSRRVQTDYAGVVEKSCQSLPFGDGETCLATPTEHLFTGKERDSESGNDYFEARYYSSNMGRFMSPDWSAKVEPVPYAKLDDPQSLNLYAYVGNNPLTREDEDGHDFGQMAALYAESNQAVKDAEAAAKKQPPTPPTPQEIAKQKIANEKAAYDKCVDDRTKPPTVKEAVKDAPKEIIGGVAKDIATKRDPKDIDFAQQINDQVGEQSGKALGVLNYCQDKHPFAPLDKDFKGIPPGDWFRRNFFIYVPTPEKDPELFKSK